jgi:hypothetical protein
MTDKAELSEVDRLNLEIYDLRKAIIDLCDMYYDYYDNRRAVRVIREAANSTKKPFSLIDVDAAIMAKLNEEL